jgi:PAS domain S-box-containing protein
MTASKEMLTGVLFDLVPVALALSRQADGTFVRVNDKFCRMFGYSCDEMLGRSSAELKLFPAGSDRRPIVEELDSKGVVRNREVVMRCRDGAPIIVLTNIDSVQVDGERHLLTSNIDISDRLWLEGVLRRVQEADAPRALADRLDPAPLQGLLEDLGSENVVALLDTFFDFAPTVADRMTAGSRDEDRDAINRGAHTLKSNAAMLGAMALATRCERLEAMTSTAPWQELRAQVDEAQRLLSNALAALRKERERLIAA